MKQNRRSNAGQPHYSPLISGSENWQQRTGVVVRSSTQSAHTSHPTSRQESHPDRNENDTGILPINAPLAYPYIPFQRENSDQYSKERALARGTLYPGLDLPLRGMVNNDKPNTPKNNLMALQFAATELGLYLDTHPEDADARTLFLEYAELAASAQADYEERFGPLVQQNAGNGDQWDWICDPWPWEICQEG